MLEVIWIAGLAVTCICVIIRISEESKMPAEAKNLPFVVACGVFLMGIIVRILTVLTGQDHAHWSVIVPTYGLLGMILFSKRLGVEGDSLWARAAQYLRGVRNAYFKRN